MERKSFKITGSKGFHITFPNGVTLSTQFGWGNYCENYNNEEISIFRSLNNENMPDVESNDCEVAIWVGKSDDGTHKWITNECEFCESEDSVEGHVKIDKWLNIFEWCKNYGTEEKKQFNESL
jgi:hypothetical protein